MLQKPEPVVQNEWIYEGEVDRPPELQEMHKEESDIPYLPPINGTNGILKPKDERPAVKYTKQPWKLTIRKEVSLFERIFHIFALDVPATRAVG